MYRNTPATLGASIQLQSTQESTISQTMTPISGVKRYRVNQHTLTAGWWRWRRSLADLGFTCKVAPPLSPQRRHFMSCDPTALHKAFGSYVLAYIIYPYRSGQCGGVDNPCCIMLHYGPISQGWFP